MAATNYKNTKFSVITGKQTVPASTPATGTIDTSGITVIGTGTEFLSEMMAGSWIYSSTLGEIRKVVRVDSDLVAYIDKAFGSDLASIALFIIPESDTHIVTMTLIATGGTPTIDGIAYGGALTSIPVITLTKEGRSTSSTRDFIDPVIVDATGGSMTVITLS
tara:strand:+ start:400 stop:888 length:489 start_codon:yes stop_codon:yes gene_type:complete